MNRKPEAPRGYRIGEGRFNLQRVRDIAAGLGSKATPDEARRIARAFQRTLEPNYYMEEEEPEEGDAELPENDTIHRGITT